MNLREELITCESYKGICDYVYKVGDEPKAGLVHVNMEEIPSFFEAIKGRPDKYILVSTCSDFGLCLQAENPVYADMPKWARMMMKPELGYSPVFIEPRCNVKACKTNDKYSVKCYSYTAFTFPKIPDNIVHWYTSNANLYDDRVTVLPFGISAGSADTLFAQMQKNVGRVKDENKLLYINWQNYTVDRFELKENYKSKAFEWVTIVEKAKPYAEYLEEMSEHTFVMSPQGNGIDCYRTLESIYLGCIPIVNATAATDQLTQGIGTMLVGRYLNEIHPGMLKQMSEKIQAGIGPMATLSFWKKSFEEARKTL